MMSGPHKVIDEKGTSPMEKLPIFLEQKASQVKQLSPFEVVERLKTATPEVKKEFPVNCTFEINGRICGIDRSAFVETPDSQSLRLFVYQLAEAIKRMREIVEGYNPQFFRIHLIPEVGWFGSITDDEVTVGINHVRDLAEVYTIGSYQIVSVQMQSRFFHEVIHCFRKEIRESVSMLGEFLYDPIGNEDYNATLERVSERMFSLVRKGESIKEPSFSYCHELGWRKTSKILLWEYGQIDSNFSIPKSLYGQERRVSRCLSLYKYVPKEQRDAILREYIPKSEEDIDNVCKRYTEELNLKF